MSQYNKTVLTHAGLELAKRANAGQAKFGITRAVTSADDWSNKTVQDLEEVTTIPNIMQQGTIMDTDEVESNNSVIGVSLCFTNKNLSTGYQIRIIGLYVREEGQENDFLYAVTTAITPEYMPSFADKVLYKFNMQMYLVIGNAQSVNVVINEGTAVTSTQFNKYKGEVTESLKELENTHKEDMSHVAKSASINGGAEILPDSTGKLNLVVPDPDLSKYVSLEQLTEILQAKADKADVNKQIKAVTDLANTKANSADVYTKTETDNQINKFDLSKVKFHKQYINSDGQAADKTWSATKNDDGTYTIDIFNDDRTASKLHDVLEQLPSKADTSTVNAQITDAKNTAQSNLDKAKSDLNDAINAKANSSDLTALDKKAVKSVGIYPNNLHFESGSFNYWSDEVKASPDANGYAVIDLPDDGPARAAADQLNVMLASINAVNNKVNVTAPLFRRITAANTWNDILGASNDNAPVLVSIRDEGGANTLGNYSAAVAFGGGDTKGVLNVAYSDHTARIIGGNGDAPVWHEDIAWKSDISNLRNQVQQLKDNQFEVQTFTDATAAASWEAQRSGKRMAIVNS